MTSIDFYFNADDRLLVACRLAAKAYAQKKKLLIFTPRAEMARRVDHLLWTWQQLSFVPHCLASDPLAAQTPVLITADTAHPPGCDVIINLGEGCPPLFERYDRVLEIVGQGDAERSVGRIRFKYYKERGYAIGTHDLAARH